MPEVLVAAAENDFELPPSLPGGQLACYVFASRRSQLTICWIHCSFARSTTCIICFLSRKREPSSIRFLSSPRHSPNLCPQNVRTFRLGLPRSNCNSLFIIQYSSTARAKCVEEAPHNLARKGGKSAKNMMVSADCLGYCLACKKGTNRFARS